MSLRELVDPECGGANPLMRLGNHIVSDVAHKDEGISGSGRMNDFAGPSTSRGFNDFSETQLVNEFLGQMRAPPPQTFRMDALLQEMREMDAQRHPIQAPTVSAEVNNGLKWVNDFDGTKNDVNRATHLPANFNEAVSLVPSVCLSISLPCTHLVDINGF